VWTAEKVQDARRPHPNPRVLPGGILRATQRPGSQGNGLTIFEHIRESVNPLPETLATDAPPLFRRESTATHAGPVEGGIGPTLERIQRRRSILPARRLADIVGGLSARVVFERRSRSITMCWVALAKFRIHVATAYACVAQNRLEEARVQARQANPLLNTRSSGPSVSTLRHLPASAAPSWRHAICQRIHNKGTQRGSRPTTSKVRTPGTSKVRTPARARPRATKGGRG